jgi:hypothetical protein
LREYRSEIVKDLEDPESQFLYLLAFFKICEASFDLKNIDDLQKVKFLVTAYNYSFTNTCDQINGMIDKKFFSTKPGSSENYPYADISVYWYKNHNLISADFK